MERRTIKNGYFEYPANWIELNADLAQEKEHIVIVTDVQTVAIFYSSTPCKDLDDTAVERIKEVARKAGLEKDRVRLYGIVDEYLGVKNVGNARIIRR
jgi:hypothetical protein